MFLTFCKFIRKCHFQSFFGSPAVVLSLSFLFQQILFKTNVESDSSVSLGRVGGKKTTSLVLQSTLKVKLFLLRFSEHAMLASGITWFEIYLEL